MDEDSTEAGSAPAVKSDGFRVPPPPGYKPKPQNTGSSDMSAKKARGLDKLLIVLILFIIFKYMLRLI